uniref:Uncharacterized protein n=1 Tax=Sciurus vulgaris TaxID=55149 RepID=A0A8D2CX40_SCIVU
HPQEPIFVGPHGPLLAWMFTHSQVSGWYEGPRKLPWCPPHKAILLVCTNSSIGSCSSPCCCRGLCR